MQKKKRAPGQIIQFKLRIRESLRAQLEREADKAKVSINSEIERRLEESFRVQDIIAVMKEHMQGMREQISVMFNKLYMDGGKK
jgi:hypothetical protein